MTVPWQALILIFGSGVEVGVAVSGRPPRSYVAIALGLGLIVYGAYLLVRDGKLR
jgi:hypothetical protein